MILFSKSSGTVNAQIGKLETPIKMAIEHESDKCIKNDKIRKTLFNVLKSNKFGETIVGQTEFEVFKAAMEGAGAENDTIEETYKKFIEHIQYMKEFTITAEMMEDANYGLAASGKLRAENFTRAYYKTMTQVCTKALINGTGKSFKYANATVDTTVFDGLPLFHKAHKLTASKAKNKTQCNRFCAAGLEDPATILSVLGQLAVKMRNFTNEQGDEQLGYIADIIILPGNQAKEEMAFKTALGSERTAGSNVNDTNIQFGNWSIIVLPEWQADKPEFMIMSSEANKQLQGNLFYDRVPLTINNWVDHHTGNYIWNGRCRFGVGFGTYKHIMLCEQGATVDGCEAITA